MPVVLRDVNNQVDKFAALGIDAEDCNGRARKRVERMCRYLLRLPIATAQRRDRRG